jgi:hypothetical protein
MAIFSVCRVGIENKNIDRKRKKHCRGGTEEKDDQPVVPQQPIKTTSQE